MSISVNPCLYRSACAGFFYHASGFELGADVGEQGVEVGLILVWRIDNDVRREEGVLEGVLGDAGLATGGLGAGGFACVLRVGTALSFGGHFGHRGTLGG